MMCMCACKGPAIVLRAKVRARSDYHYTNGAAQLYRSSTN